MGCFKNIWTPVRDTLESAAVLGGNYLLPGSSLLTDNLASKGSQEQLNSTIGKIANIGSGLAGAGAFSGVDAAGNATGIPGASTFGGGWTNVANDAGNLVGAGDVGTSVSNGVSSLLSGAGNAVSNAASGVGNALGLNGSGSGGGLFSSLFGSGTPGVASDGLNVGQAYNGTAAENTFLANAGKASGISGGGSLASALPAATGGGGSSYGTIGSLLGAANSLNANDKAQKDLLSAQTNSMNVLQPFLQSGTANNSKLSELLGSGTNTGSADFGSLNKAFNPSDLQNDPGYKFQVEQGNQALDRKAAAGGNYFSGAALKAGQDYNASLADTTYNQAYQRDLANKQNTYNMYAGQSGAGLNAANSAGQIYGNTGNAKANAGIASSNILNQTLSSMLNGSGAKKAVNVGGQIVYI